MGNQPSRASEFRQRVVFVATLAISMAAVLSAANAVAANQGGCVRVGTSDPLSTMVDRRPDGTTFCISPGVHRLTKSVVVKGHDQIIGDSGAVLDGSRLLKNFVKSGSNWFAANQKQQSAYLVGQCELGYPMCRHPEDVFFDDRPLHHVESLRDLKSGCFYFDYAGDRIYIADNPSGHKVEAAVVDGPLLTGYGLGHAVIKGLIVQKSMGPGIRGTDWDIESNQVRLNHRSGISVSHDGVIRNNYIHDNGQLGVGMTGTNRTNDVIDHNEISRNNYAGYCTCWEAGGVKYTLTTNLTISANFIHDNFGPGVWIDYDNDNVLIEGNQIDNNNNEGIIVEASFDTIVRNNLVRQNGHGMQSKWMQGAGIVDQSSANVDVYGNKVVGNLNGIGATERARGTGPFGTREVRNFTVHDNQISMNSGQSGLVETTGDASYYTSKGNRFWNNSYLIGCAGKPFVWSDPAAKAPYGNLTLLQWQGLGNDTGVAVTSSCL